MKGCVIYQVKYMAAAIVNNKQTLLMKKINCIMKHQMVKIWIVLIALVCIWQSNQAWAQDFVFDIGIFATSSNEIEVYVRPDFDVHEDHVISEIRYTIRWSDPSAEITSLVNVSPYNIDFAPASDIVDGGYRYQTFIVLAGTEEFGTNIPVNEEVLISSFTHTAVPGTTFELATDAMTPLPNTDYFFEMSCGIASGPCIGPGDPNSVNVRGILYEQEITTPAVAVPLSYWSIIITMLCMGGAWIYFRNRI